MRIMSMMGIRDQYNTPFAIPHWEYAKYFENNILQIDNVSVSDLLKEPYFHYNQFLLSGHDYEKGVIDLRGFFQSPRYWTERLSFKKGYLAGLRRKYDFSKRPIAISLRLGKDMTENPCYYKVHPVYYISALTHFPDYKERQLFIFSDNLELSKKYFSFANNVTFVDAEDIEQLAVMTMCSDFIVSQSTFSYVGAYLANTGKVIRPIKNFDGEFANKNSEKDFWVDSWIIHDYEKKTT